MLAKILIVEDDVNLLATLKYNLRKEGFIVLEAMDGAAALDIARAEMPDLIILDIMLPKMDGFEVCRILRKDMTVPILILSARVEEIDKVVGLELGADDYMTKPFSVRELLARVRALLRRSELSKTMITPDQHKILKSGELEVDLPRRKVLLDKKELQFSNKEFELLSFLMKNKGIVFSREKLLEQIWGYNYTGNTRTVDVHIRWIRQKIEDNPDEPTHLITVRGAGYKFMD